MSESLCQVVKVQHTKPQGYPFSEGRVVRADVRLHNREYKLSTSSKVTPRPRCMFDCTTGWDRRVCAPTASHSKRTQTAFHKHPIPRFKGNSIFCSERDQATTTAYDTKDEQKETAVMLYPRMGPGMLGGRSLGLAYYFTNLKRRFF